jgi:spore coat protein A
MVTRRHFLETSAMAGAATLLPWKKLLRLAYAQLPGGTLPPADIPQYVRELVKPPAMPLSRTIRSRGRLVHGYDIAVRQFFQEILPPPLPRTKVWSYGSVQNPGTFNYPAFTIEARHGTVARVEWRNELVDADGNFLPHLLPVDQTLHWANPPGPPDSRGTNPAPYMGPVPIVTHVHGAHTTQESDGYPEAWYLPNANNIPFGFAEQGSFYDVFKASSPLGTMWGPGKSVFEYPNDQRATTLWYHDHTLGMTRLNVYAGPAGFYLIRGGADDRVVGMLPGPAPGVGDDPFGEYGEIPIAIQDRSFNTDGSLFYPDNRAFFEGLNPDQLQIPFIPDPACDGLSDVPPIWQPEFFGNTMVVNGRTWPFVEVEQRRYRLRLLNGCNSRFLVLKMTTQPRTDNDGFNTPEGNFWQIGSEGGFLSQAVELDQLPIAWHISISIRCGPAWLSVLRTTAGIRSAIIFRPKTKISSCPPISDLKNSMSKASMSGFEDTAGMYMKPEH